MSDEVVISFPGRPKPAAKPAPPTPAQRAREIADRFRKIAERDDAAPVRAELIEAAHKLDALAVNLGPDGEVPPSPLEPA